MLHGILGDPGQGGGFLHGCVQASDLVDETVGFGIRGAENTAFRDLCQLLWFKFTGVRHPLFEFSVNRFGIAFEGVQQFRIVGLEDAAETGVLAIGKGLGIQAQLVAQSHCLGQRHQLPDRAGYALRIGKDVIPGTADVISAGRRHAAHRDDNRNFQFLQPLVD